MAESEVGFKFNQDAKKGLSLYLMQENQEFVFKLAEMDKKPPVFKSWRLKKMVFSALENLLFYEGNFSLRLQFAHRFCTQIYRQI